MGVWVGALLLRPLVRPRVLGRLCFVHYGVPMIRYIRHIWPVDFQTKADIEVLCSASWAIPARRGMRQPNQILRYQERENVTSLMPLICVTRAMIRIPECVPILRAAGSQAISQEKPNVLP